ncbi:MAG: hypothetical protein ACM3XR_02095 [Bacillota bacterium]
MRSKCTANELISGNVPARTGTAAFMQIYPIGRNKLLEFCSMKNAPVIKNGNRYIIKTAEMIQFIENQAVVNV